MSFRRSFAPLAGVLLVLVACRGEESDASATPSPAGAPSRAVVELDAEDVEHYLAVRAVALERLERELTAVEQGGVGTLANVEELSVAERKATQSAGVDWGRYTVVRDEIAHLLSLQRQREDAKVLGLELRHAREDLVSQLAVARDQASRQFLQAQADRLSAEIDKLDRERQPSEAELRHQELLARVRTSIATQQGRLEKVQRQIKSLLQQTRAAGSEGLARPATPVN